MNCRSFNEIVTDLAGNSENPGTREALEHASFCEACGEIFQQHLRLNSLLSEYKEADPGHVSGVTEEKVLVRFRSRNRRSIRYWDVAAVLALGVISSVIYYGYARPGVVRSHTPPVVTKPSSTEAWRIVESKPLPFAEKKRRLEITSDFIPLYDHVALNPAQIVRVQLNQDALRQLGLWIPDSPVSGRVLADVVLSEEGTPQAIRLVRKTSF